MPSPRPALERSPRGEIVERRLGNERFIADLASSLVTASAVALDECIRHGLDQLAGQTGAERSSLARFADDGAWLTITHSCGKPVIPAPDRIDLRWYLEQLRQGIGEPFYTTKPQGLGMGLAISRSIVEAHGGRLWAERRRRSGLVVSLMLPTEHSNSAPVRLGRTAPRP